MDFPPISCIPVKSGGFDLYCMAHEELCHVSTQRERDDYLDDQALWCIGCHIYAHSF